MTIREAFLPRLDHRSMLLIGVSIATLASGLAATPANAQSTLSGILGTKANAPKPQPQGPSTTPQRGVTMNQALSRQRATSSRAEQIRAYVISARDAVVAANRGNVTDGLSSSGLDPTANIREAVAAARAGDSARANELLIAASASLDDTGLKTWQGAGLPAQTTGADGKIKVAIDQTQERALLSWNSFNIGANTTLQFNQKSNGVAQPGWVAVNRVSNAVAPSQILGNLTADGTVVVLNQSGIIFGQNSQVNTHSLLASTLELGNAARFVSGNTGPTQATTIAERNSIFLQNGLFTPANGTTGRIDAGYIGPLLVSGMSLGNGTQFSNTPEGGIVVDHGANIKSSAGGFVMLTAPKIENAGTLIAVDGQVSLQAGRAVTYDQSTGAGSASDPFVRGYKLNSFVYSGQAEGTIVNAGLIESRRGYISLGTGADGSITHSGLLSTTTSVSRNGKISLTSGSVLLAGSSDPAMASGIEMLADGNGETIPRGSANEPAGFKTSQIEIGTQILIEGRPVGALIATNFSMGRNALIYAPGANISVGVKTITDETFDVVHPGHIDIAGGAMIDVSGLKDVQLAASRNQIAITPVKRGELRDTPNYREVALDGNFSLNGATLYVDPRISGVRDDGVAWVGSPLIEAGSLASQISSSAAEFLTKGGSVNLSTSELRNFSNVRVSTAPSVHIARDAVIDFSGGWVNYAAGSVKTSKLVTNDGRVVDISQANPNDVYVGVAEGFSSVQPRFGVLNTFVNPATETSRYEQSYDEGRDAGALTINAAAVSVDGTVYGNAFAGARQINRGTRPSLASQASGRLLQRSPYELPAGGALSITSLGDVLVYHGRRGSAESDWSELLLDDTMLSGAGLSRLSLSAAGSVTFADAAPFTLQTPDALTITGASRVELAPGGALVVGAGRTIRFDGTVEVASGSITARTMLVGKATDALGAGHLDLAKSNGSAFRTGLYGDGNGDDISPNYLYAQNPGDLNPFDIVVTGSLSTAGLWVNDFAQAGLGRGGAFSDGGSISLTVAPRVFAAVGSDLESAREAIDLSGSIRLRGSLNVGSGGYVTPTGGLVLTGKGGDVSLINATVYASTNLTFSGLLRGDTDFSAVANLPIEGTNQSVEFTPVPGGQNVDAVLAALVPTPSSTIDLASGSIRGFGFAGGGTFTLVAPDISFGSDNRAGSTHIGFDFFRTTGFGTLDVSSYRSRIVDDVFANDRVSKSAFLETTRFVVGAGERFDLTQWMLPTFLNADQTKALRGLATGADLTAQSFLSPTKNDNLWDQRAAHLVLGGLTELDVLAGGQVTGAPEASLTVSKLYNAGSIILHGGTISQRGDLIMSLLQGGLGVRGTDLGGRGLAEAFGGPPDAEGRFNEQATNAAGVTSSGRLLTNQELVTREGADRLIYFLGLMDESRGVLLTSGSTTDLSGVALVNPRAPFKSNGDRIRVGRVVDGGTLRTDPARQVVRSIAANALATIDTGRTLVRQDGATLDISGASAVFDQAIGLGSYAPYLEWSKAGTISALAGGSLGTTLIAARGGNGRAEGGVLEWLRPTIGGSSGGSDFNYLSANLIAQSGFDTLIARGGLTLDGDFSLTLRKALMVTSQDPVVAGNLFDTDASVSIGATAGTNASISASYIRFASRRGIVGGDVAQAGDADVRFIAGTQGIDLAGGIRFDKSIASLLFGTPGDVRLIGVNDQTPGNLPVYNGQLFANADITFDARRTYATTGTGNLQGMLEALPADRSRPYDLLALGDHKITFGNSYLDPNAPLPLSAGSHLRVLAAQIIQNGYLAAPLGLLELGSATSISVDGTQSTPTRSVTFGAGSITTVSGFGTNIPYGTTTDLIEYFFPTLGTPITRLPAGELRLAGNSIVQETGALFDGRGGGDVFAYEFQSGVGGSRDVLDRFNRDGFSSNGYDPATGIGYQYADRRQVFALVAIGQLGKIAPYDPIYSADYGSAGPVDLYGANAGRTVILDGGQGVAAGEYLLVPAKYAMSIPGALRLVENTDAAALIPGTSSRLLDGSIVVGGTYGYAGTGISESARRSFTVQSKDVFLKYSQIKTTSGSGYIAAKAVKGGLGRSRLPLDAARVVLAPLSELRVAGIFDTTPVDGGQGGQFDILGQNIVIGGDGRQASAGVLRVSDSTLNKLNAASLLVGGQRTENADGTTTIAATAANITVAGGAHLQAPELLLAVGGNGSRLTVEDGAQIAAIGAVGTQSGSDYMASADGSLLRLANGKERLVTRTGTGSNMSSIEIGAATLSGDALGLDSSGSFAVSNAADLHAKWIAVSGQSIRFDGGNDVAGQAGVIGSNLEAKLALAERLTVRSPGTIRFSAGTHQFNDLVLDTASLAASARGGSAGSVLVKAGNARLLNSTGANDGCATAGMCAPAGSFTLNAATLSFGANSVRATGFAGGVTLAASDGMYVEGKGSFSTGDASLTLRTPFLADRASAADPREQKVRPDYTFLSTGDFAMNAAGTNGAAKIDGNAAPGARIAIGTIDDRARSVAIDGGRIRATAGIIDIQSKTDIALRGASLEVPGFEQTFGDKVDPVTVSAGGGTINLLAANGNINLDSRTSLVSDTGLGSAGTINLLASNGAITLDATINSEAKGRRQGSFTFDSGTGAFGLGGFVDRYGTLFGGDFRVRSGAGNLDLGAGQTLNAKNVTLTADGGAITIAGTIDTSGVNVSGMSADDARNAAVNGGDIALWGNSGVTLTSTARLDTHTTGYAATDSRPATAGDVTIGIKSQSAAITIAKGAIIDAGARRTQADPGVGRLIPQVITDPATGNPVTVYRYAEPDAGGKVSFRAPVIGDGKDKVAVSLGGAIQGAGSIQLEAFQRYDLDAIANSGLYSGISRAADGTLLLNMAAVGANPFTERFTLADGTSSLVQFIQDFGVSTVDGSSLEGVRLRPGVELASTGGIKTETQWNLAAASFSPEQLQAAVGAGVLKVIPELSQGGQTQYRVVPGREGDLLEHYATFLYRVDGSARGEAPVVTLRAGGNLTVNRSISDGFFTFRDKSDPAYTNYQLGGGDRGYSPALQFSCGGNTGNCGTIVSYRDGVANNPGVNGTIAISLSSAAVQGDMTSGAPYVNSPLSLIGNGAAGAVDANGNPVGDTLGFGELFPLLSSNTAMHSSDLRLVAGAGSILSANPLQVNRALNADMTVSGEFSYRLTATGTVNYAGPLQFRLFRSSTDTNQVNFNIGDTLKLTNTTAGLDRLKDDAYTQFSWGTGTTGLSADARAAARAYFAGKGYSFTGSANQPSGIIAPLSEVVGFLQSFEPTYQAGLATGRTGYSANRTPPVIRYGNANQQNSPDAPNQAHVRTYIRTGDGAVDVAASRDIDLRGASAPVYRRADGTLAQQPNYDGSQAAQAAQFASAAIYTSGVRVAPININARVMGDGALVSITPDSPYLVPGIEKVDFIPSPRALSDTLPVLARGGGDIVLDAGRDVLGRRDAWSETLGASGQSYAGASNGSSTGAGVTAGQFAQRWLTGGIGVDTELGIASRYFTSGVGALGGGDVKVRAGRDVTDLNVVLASGVTTNMTDAGAAMLAFGSGDLSVAAGRDILAGRFDIATGAASVHADGDVAAFGMEPLAAQTPQYLRIRLSNAVVDVSARGAATVASVSALGVDQSFNSAGFFSPAASFSLSATGTAKIAQTAGIGGRTDYGQQPSYIPPGVITPTAYTQVLPPTLEMTSLTSSVELPRNSAQLLYPSTIGQLRLFSAGNIDQLVIAMSDADPSSLGGAFAAPAGTVSYQLPFVTVDTTDAQLRDQHNQRITHAGDPAPVRIYSNGDIDQSAIFLPKQARITAAGDIVDMFFNGQNLSSEDVTRIRAGGDIVGTTAAAGGLPFVKSSNFILGGPGTLIVEAGGDLGPFVTSANVTSPVDGKTYTFAGGIRTIGNDYNPWLTGAGADMSVRFGMAAGADYAALRETYLNPENLARLDGDLFEQVKDSFGNQRPDRGKPIYAPLLAEWLRDNAPDAFASLFGGQNFPDTPAGNAVLAVVSYGKFADLYTAFSKIDPLRQQDFLVNDLYFNELAQAGNSKGPSYLQYVRGYRAIQTLFPKSLGYTDNLAPYTLDPSTVSEDHPLGEPVRNIVAGQPQRAKRVITGNVDLRLATIQTGRGGNVTILGPGGDIIAGSVVRTSDQPQRRATAFSFPNAARLPGLEAGDLTSQAPSRLASVPLGFEGVLTLQGGQIRSFTDGDFILNQSRVFTQQSGNITMWSSNGDLNAGQGPKSASNFPPVTVRFDENGLAEVNSAGSVAGAGIGAFKRTPSDPPSDVILIAPVGEVDAGDAGVRASGNIVVAAARVANADNFKAAGDITGVPSSAVTAKIASPGDAASAIAAQAAGASNAANNQGDRRSVITVDVLGPAGAEKRCPGSERVDQNCSDDDGQSKK
ncbi:filamentous hemagglutinin family protein [Sphingomonas sp. QA11]|uniref:filamentous haemagglutinin family protein n=1 Tax=Sphingomonas sp. QA11 TaxID=2950605 RepID=UPI0023490213|nr:filamentous haemagglutinin family protein [Sphingomonas sp. QA11]WCM28024.1 filamentous hemagglutinin family protein [Sphingomonas sp. QA11]